MLIRTRHSIERAVKNTDEEFGLSPAPVEPEDELVEVALQVLRADAVEGPRQPGLQIPEDGVRPRQRINGLVAVPALARAMIDPESTQRGVRTPGIGEDRGSLPLDRLLYERREHGGRGSRNHGEPREAGRPGAPLDRDRDAGLADAPPFRPVR